MDLIMYKIKRFSRFGFGSKKSEPSKTKYTEQELRAKMAEISQALPVEYKKMLQASNDIAKFENAHDYEFLYLDYEFPYFYVYDLEDLAKEWLSAFSSYSRLKDAGMFKYPKDYDKQKYAKDIWVLVARLSTAGSGKNLHYNISTKEWDISSDDYLKYLTQSSLKSDIIRHEENLRDSWLKDPPLWFDSNDLENFKEFTNFVISTLKKRL